MYDNTTLRILEQIYKNFEIHKRELSRKTKLSMPAVENCLNKLKEIIKEKKSGNQIKYSINYSKINIVPALYSLEYFRFNKLPAKAKFSIIDFLKNLTNKPLIAVLFGSYGREDYNTNSDIDILLVFQEKFNSKEIENAAKSAGMANGTKISPVYLNYEDFKKSFYDSRKEFFKNLKEDKIIISGILWWRELENEKS